MACRVEFQCGAKECTSSFVHPVRDFHSITHGSNIPDGWWYCYRCENYMCPKCWKPYEAKEDEDVADDCPNCDKIACNMCKVEVWWNDPRMDWFQCDSCLDRICPACVESIRIGERLPPKCCYPSGSCSKLGYHQQVDICPLFHKPFVCSWCTTSFCSICVGRECPECKHNINWPYPSPLRFQRRIPQYFPTIEPF